LIQAEKINSNDPKLHHMLAEIYLKLGRRDEATREHEILTRLDRVLADALAKSLNAPT
jgi:Flp pilus assembly protein TadD